MKLLRKSGKPVFLVANKIDDARHEPEAAALWNLGLGEPHPVSAIHGRGVADLLDEIMKVLPEVSAVAKHEIGGPRRVAILGRPNVGKSSLLNKAAGEERVVVNELAGTTRDPVDEIVDLGGRLWRFVDTAGIRRRVHLQQGADFYASLRTSAALEKAEVAVVVLDVSESISEQDVRIIDLVLESGRALVLAFNKWDRLSDNDLENADRRRYLEREIEQDLAHVAWAPRVNISARTGRHLEKLVPALETALDSWDTRIPTGKFNAFLSELVAEHPHPLRGGKQPRILFGTQASTRPPTFVLFTTGFLDPGYRRFIQRRLREIWGFEGTPIVINMRVREKRTALADRRLRRRAHHRGRVRHGEAELLVQAVRVGGEEHPAELATRTVLDHRLHETLAETVSLVLGDDEHVGEVGEPDSVRGGAGEADEFVGARSVGADEPPRAVQLRLDVGAGAPAPPVGLGRQPRPDGVAGDPRGVVVEFVAGVVHPGILPRPAGRDEPGAQSARQVVARRYDRVER